MTRCETSGDRMRAAIEAGFAEGARIRAQAAPYCATAGHSSRPATHEVTWSTPASRDEPVTEPACAACAAAAGIIPPPPRCLLCLLPVVPRHICPDWPGDPEATS
jgi:hypothetical protein